MFKKLLILSVLTVFLFAGGLVLAKDDLPNPGITPDSPFYFLDTLGEQIELFLSFSPTAKAERATQIAAEKAAEVEAMIEENKPDAVETAATRYGELISLAAQSIRESEDRAAAVAALVAQATSIHLTVLTGLLDKVPEQARNAIENALTKSENGAQSALDALQDETDLRSEVQDKINAARAKRGAE
ncbi:MAG TPA: DUF5667 domain-containing protein [Patescibacteria group bacterium]|nr:DUF5667 domain-containing protein [Patescibacteria group bacterium]